MILRSSSFELKAVTRTPTKFRFALGSPLSPISRVQSRSCPSQAMWRLRLKTTKLEFSISSARTDRVRSAVVSGTAGVALNSQRENEHS